MPIHPPFAMFPLPLLTFALILSIVSLYRKNKTIQKIVLLALLLSSCVASVAFVTGLFEVQDMELNEHKQNAVSQHFIYARASLMALWVTTSLCIASIYARSHQKLIQRLFLFFLVATWGLTVLTSRLGGVLVFVEKVF
jgi:uncharacterized membrane protein